MSLLTEAGQALWRLNQEYAQRLTHARNCVSLLADLLAVRDETTSTAYSYALQIALERLNATLTSCYEDHRAWRYRYFYESVEEKRMKQADADVFRALSQFSRIRLRQFPLVHDALSTLLDLPRPQRELTRIPQGDLWDMTAQALLDFAELDTALSP
jgi:hypothetical protein